VVSVTIFLQILRGYLCLLFGLVRLLLFGLVCFPLLCFILFDVFLIRTSIFLHVEILLLLLSRILWQVVSFTIFLQILRGYLCLLFSLVRLLLLCLVCFPLLCFILFDVFLIRTRIFLHVEILLLLLTRILWQVVSVTIFLQILRGYLCLLFGLVRLLLFGLVCFPLLCFILFDVFLIRTSIFLHVEILLLLLSRILWQVVSGTIFLQILSETSSLSILFLIGPTIFQII